MWGENRTVLGLRLMHKLAMSLKQKGIFEMWERYQELYMLKNSVRTLEDDRK